MKNRTHEQCVNGEGQQNNASVGIRLVAQMTTGRVQRDHPPTETVFRSKKRLSLSCLTAFTAMALTAFVNQSDAANMPIDSAAARTQLLNGVSQIGHPGTSYTGHMAVYGDTSFSVAINSNTAYRPIMAAGTWEQSRVFAFGRTKWNEFDACAGAGDMATLYTNIVQWAADSSSLSIKIVSDDAGTVSWLQGQGFTDVTHDANWESSGLNGVDLLICLLGENATVAEQSALTGYVQTGGGLVVTAYGYGWSDYDGSATNTLFGSCGLGWTGGRTTHGSAPFDLTSATDMGNARAAADILANPGAFTDAQKDEAGQALVESGVVLVHGSTALADLMATLSPHFPSLTPTPATPITESMAKKVVMWESTVVLKTPVADTVKHRASFDVGAGAARVNTTRTLNAPDGHATIRIPTGLYAAPGDVVTVSVPAGFETKGLRVRISHLRTDTNDTNFYHMPYQQIYFNLDSSTVDIASPYGGLISIEAASGEDGISNVTFGFDNVVEAPYFVHGQTTNTEWVNSIRDRATPFGVMQTEKIILVVDAETQLRDLADPVECMDIWHNMITHIQEFYSYTTYRPLRVHMDYQPVGGFSSFPQSYGMTANLLDYKKLVNFGNGLTHHEYGHIIDPSQMHITNFSEASPNFGGAYASRFFGPFTYRPKFAQERMRRYAVANGHNDIWVTSPHSYHHEKITPFICLADSFGWDKLINVVAALRQTSPADNQEKLDNWLTLYGAEIGYDISPFFNLWKLYPSATALAAVSGLPQWNMVETLQDRLVLHQDTAVSFPSPAANDFSYDGGLTLTGTTSPSHGVLTDLGNGYFRYTPAGGFTGSDSFTYTVTNATGNTFTATVPITVLAEANSPKLHVGVTTASTDAWTTVNLPHSYTSPVVVAQHIQSNGMAGMVTRIRNASANSFEVMLQRTDGSADPVTGVTINYTVAEEGVYDEATHGIKMEAVKWSSTTTDSSTNMVGTEFEPRHKVLNHYAEPVFLGQVMSFNDSNWSTYWHDPSSLAIKAGKHVGADSNTARADETIGYIAMEAGTMQFGQQYMRFGNGSTQLGASFGAAGMTVSFPREPQLTGALVQAYGSKETENAYWTALTDTNSYAANMVGMILINDDGSAVPSDPAFFMVYSTLSETPDANDDVVSTLADSTVVITPLNNDVQGVGDPLVITGFTQGAYGMVTDNGDGTLSYTPRVTGVTDVFSYTVSNGTYTDTATVSVTSTLSEADFEVDDGWPAYGDNTTNALATTTDNYGFTWSTPNTAQIRNRSDIPASGVQCLMLGSGEPDTAEVAIAGTTHGLGQIIFDYACGSSSANGTLSLYYRVDGGAWVQAWTTPIIGKSPNYASKPWPFVTVDINQEGDVDFKFESTGSGSFFIDTVKASGYSVNAFPVAAADVVSTDEDVAVLIDLLANDSDADDALSILSMSAPAHGSLVDHGDGTVTYTPDPGTSGSDSFSYTLEDPSGARSTASVQITVNDVYDPIEAVADTLSVNASGSGVVNVLSNDGVDTGLTASMLGFANRVIVYDAGISGAPADPASVQGGSWTFYDAEDSDPNAGSLTATASIDDNGSGLDAWIMRDQTQNSGKHTHYTKTLTAEQQVTADTSGWALNSTMRFIDDYGDSQTNILMYGNGTTRFLIFFDLDSNDDLTARTFGTGGATYTLTTGGTGSAEFHDFSILYDPQTQTAAFMVDGVRIDAGNWSGQASSFAGVQWGTGSSGGRGSAAYHSVELTIFEPGLTLASGATLSYLNGDVSFDANGAYASLGTGASVDEVVTYVVEDGTGNHTTGTVTITVQGENDAPVVNDASGTLAEDSAIGSSVTSVTSSDVDAGDFITYAITDGNSAGAFVIDSLSGEITTASALDYEAASAYHLTVTGTDSQGLSDTSSVVVTVTNVNEAPTASDTNGSVAENTVAGAHVATVLATDPDAADTLSYAITAGNGSGLFSIDSNGSISTTAPLDFESVSQYVLTVTVTDAGGLSNDAAVTVNVTDVNEAPVSADTSGTLAEDAAIGSTVATVVASDVDAGDNLNYAMIAGNGSGAFVIDANGVISTATALDFETTSSYSLTVRVTDSGALSATANVLVTVTDVLEVTVPAASTGAASNLSQTAADIAYSITDDGGENPTVTLYYGATDGGAVTGAWDSSQALGALSAGSYNTSISGLTENTTYYYAIHASNSAGEVWGGSGSFTTVADMSPKLVRTTVSAVSNTTWTTVDLGKNYNSAVIVATPIYPDSNTPPVVTRVTNVNGSSFDLKIDRADGLTDAVSVDVSVIAVEEGVYTQATDGVTMEAVKFTSTVTAHKNSWNAEARTYQNTYIAPVVVGQVMSTNDANWSVFWSMGSSRTNAVDASSLNVGKHVAEDSNTTRADETVGYIVIESGSGTINGVAYEAGVGADLPEGVGETTTGWDYTLSGNLSSASAAVLSQSGMDGNDGGWAVLYGATPFTTTTLTLAIDEDQMANTERNHVNEQACYLVFE